MSIEVAVSAAVSKQHLSQDAGRQPETDVHFPRTGRLLRHADFERVYKLGKRHFSASMTFFYLQRSDVLPTDRQTADSQTEDRQKDRKKENGQTKERRSSAIIRVGFTVGRALGGAVERNRMKRRLREAVRLSSPAGTIAADIVINPKRGLVKADFTDVVNEIKKAFVVIEQKLTGKGVPRVAPQRSSGTLKPEA